MFLTIKNVYHCEIQPTVINSHRNEYGQELNNYPLAVKLDKRLGSCNTLNGLSNKVCFPNKREDLNIHVFNMITGKNESNILTKDILCECKCRFDGKNVIQINKITINGIEINVNVSVKNVMCVKSVIFGILLHVVVKMENI